MFSESFLGILFPSKAFYFSWRSLEVLVTPLIGKILFFLQLTTDVKIQEKFSFVLGGSLDGD